MAATLTSTGVNFSDGSTINGTVNNTIGSYSLLARTTNTTVTYNIGSTLAGSNLRPIGLTMSGYAGWPVGNQTGQTAGQAQNTTMSGTWRCMGYMYTTNGCINLSSATLWVRIS